MFELESVQGTATQIKAELEGLPKHEREDLVISKIKEAVDSIIEAVGGYLSVSVNGNLNPVAGDTGDLVQIYITSLPYPPNYTSGEVPVVEVEEKPEDPSILAPVLPPVAEPGLESGQENTEIPPGTIPPVEQPIAPVNPETTTPVEAAHQQTEVSGADFAQGGVVSSDIKFNIF